MSLRETKVISLPALRVVQPIGEFLIASIDARLLVDIAYADVRRMETRDIERYLGIQRPLSAGRVKAIRKYIQSKDATFPTAIIIAVDEKCAEYDERSQKLFLHPFISDDKEETDIPNNKIAKILDGQHRLAGFLEGEGNQRSFSFDDEFKINVAVFIGIDIAEQAKIFATVNLAQTKVNKSLVYDLEDLALKRNPYKSCHHIAVALDRDKNSPFYHRIKRLGVATPDRSYEPLTQASFVESLVNFLSEDPIRDRNDMLDGKKPKISNPIKCPFNQFFRQGEKGDLIIYKIIFNYFEAVRRKWPNAWNDIKPSGNLLPKANAFKALMKYLKTHVYHDLVNEAGEDIPTIDKFLTKFKHVKLTDRDFKTRNFAPGSAGQSAFYKVLTGETSAEDLFE